MKRLLAILAIVGLVVLIASPAKAAPSELGTCKSAPLDLLGISVPLDVCVRVDGDQAITSIVNGAGKVVDTVVAPVERIVDRVEVPVIVPGPPPAPVTVTQPRATVTQAPATVTVTEDGPTITETAAPSTVTASPAPSENAQAGQDQDESGRVVNDSTPTLAVPPSDDEPGPIFDFVPDDPEVAAATFSILGLLAGIVLGIIGLFVAYKRGRTDGEQATMDEFLGTIRGTGPKHRA